MICLSHEHERGDWPYERARWTFGVRDELVLTSYDGESEPHWERCVERQVVKQLAQGPLGFSPLDGLSRNRKE